MQKVRPSAMGWHSSMPLRPQMRGRVRMSGMKQTPFLKELKEQGDEE